MVPYNTLSAVSTEDIDERTKLVTARNMFGFVGPLAIGAVSMPVVNFLGAGQLAWSVLTGIYGVLGALCYLWVYFSVKEVGAEERYEAHLKNGGDRQDAAEKKEQRNVLDDLKALVQNKYWLIVLLIQLIIFFNYGVKAGYQTYYVRAGSRFQRKKYCCPGQVSAADAARSFFRRPLPEHPVSD